MQSARQVDAVAYVTANDAPERDPVAFMLEGLSDSWRPLAAPAGLSPPTARHQETVIIAATAALDSNQRLGLQLGNAIFRALATLPATSRKSHVSLLRKTFPL